MLTQKVLTRSTDQIAEGCTKLQGFSTDSKNLGTKIHWKVLNFPVLSLLFY